MDPGSYITIAQLAYYGAAKAIQLCRDAIYFPSDAQDLLIQFELERFRFQTWGANAGLTQETFHESLHPVFEGVRDRLNKIQALFTDVRRMGDRFGFVAQKAEPVSPEKAHSLISQWVQSLKDVGICVNETNGSSDDEQVSKTIATKDKVVARRQLRQRIRWAISDKKQFRNLVSLLEGHTNKLNQLLTETQHQSLRRDWARINIIVVGKLDDEKALDVVRQAISGGSQAHLHSMNSLVENKSVLAAKDSAFDWKACNLLSLEDFEMPGATTERRRFIAKRKKQSADSLVLFEQKEFDPDITDVDMRVLEDRVKRLLLLLCLNKSAHFLSALGYILDAESHCWWLVFGLPKGFSPVPNATGTGSGPVSLLSRLGNQGISEAPLEKRYRLASNLAAAYRELFCSNWLHKGIRSENILFLNPADISSPTVAGFEYSRQESELASINKARDVSDVDCAIYRHPNYQGKAAMGYKIDYDIYSFGLVLAEIGWWMSLKDSVLAAKPGRQPLVELSPTMKRFHTEEAIELRSRVLYRVKRDMAYRMGTVYTNVVIWCLEFAQTSKTTDKLWPAALDFSDNVFVPLDKLAAE